MIAKCYPYYLANKACIVDTRIAVRDKFKGNIISHVSSANEEIISEAIDKAVQAFRAGKFPGYKRREVLEYCVRRFEEAFDDFAHILCIEAGKPIRDARSEVQRLIDTFRIASSEVFHSNGEVLSMDVSPRSEQYTGMWRYVPIGPCAFISPFNFPLNLVAHKIAPALAVGNPFVLKPASKTPIGALLIGKVLSECDLPEGYFSILPCDRMSADKLVSDERIRLLSFTGSHSVGWDMKMRAGKKKVLLELGGNAACIVDEGLRLDEVIPRMLVGVFYQSGQSCISVQRIYVHRNIYEIFKEKLVTATQSLVLGDPKEEETFIGPMIDEREASRLEQWVNSACAKGAKLLCGGTRRGAMFDATLLENVAATEPIYKDEAFGPVAILEPFYDFDEAISKVNDSAYGLQVGIFTHNVQKVLHAWEQIEVGGVIVNDVPSWRVDHMPYGGVKDSGNTREGIRFSMEEMSEIKLLVIRRE